MIFAGEVCRMHESKGRRRAGELAPFRSEQATATYPFLQGEEHDLTTDSVNEAFHVDLNTNAVTNLNPRSRVQEMWSTSASKIRARKIS